MNKFNGELLYLTDKHHVFVLQTGNIVEDIPVITIQSNNYVSAICQERIDSRFGITHSFVQLLDLVDEQRVDRVVEAGA